MPEIGDTRRAKEIGDSWNGMVIWHACPDCGQEYWVRLIRGKPRTIRCHPCALKKISRNPQRLQKISEAFKGERHPAWNGGESLDSNGYVLMKLSSQNPYYTMAHINDYAFKHRVIMAQYLGRNLLETEIVHHIDGDRQNNAIGNLMLFASHGEHRRYHLGLEEMT